MNKERSVGKISDQRTEFEKKRASYFSRFALRHLKDMRILQKGGILGKENKDWRNIGEHTIVEAVGADILAEALGANRKDIVQAANLHDWYKRHEVEAMKKLGGAAGHKEASTKDEELLRELGISENIIRLAHANIPKSIEPAYLAQRSIEEKILHYMDMILISSNFVGYEARSEAASKNPRVVEFCNSYREQYGGLSLLDVGRKLATEEQAEFEKLLGLPPGTLVSFIKEKLQERIEKS